MKTFDFRGAVSQLNKDAQARIARRLQNSRPGSTGYDDGFRWYKWKDGSGTVAAPGGMEGIPYRAGLLRLLDAIIEIRRLARGLGAYEIADMIRSRLLELGISVEDH